MRSVRSVSWIKQKRFTRGFWKRGACRPTTRTRFFWELVVGRDHSTRPRLCLLRCGRTAFLRVCFSPRILAFCADRSSRFCKVVRNIRIAIKSWIYADLSVDFAQVWLFTTRISTDCWKEDALRRRSRFFSGWRKIGARRPPRLTHWW